MARIPLPLRMLAEAASAAELPRLLWRCPELLRQPRGNGEPVLVLPGFGADDLSTLLLRSYLRMLGYRVCGWGLGLNRGDIPEILPRAAEAVRRCADASGQRVRIVGWSLGGVIAREIARDEPELVERVITMGSPVCGGPRYTAGRLWFELRGYDLDAIEAEVLERNRILLQVPVTAIVAIFDGIVSRRSCFDRWSKVEHIEVRTSHLGLGMNADVYRIIAQRLASRAMRRRRSALRSDGSRGELRQTG